MDAGGDLTSAVGEFADADGHLARRTFGRALEQLDVDVQERELLAEVVVQLACDASPLGLLSRNQPAGEVLNLQVARSQSGLVSAQCVFRLPSLGNVASDALHLDDTIVRIDDDMIEPLLPSDSPIRQKDFVLVDVGARVLQKRFQMASDRWASALGDETEEWRSDQRFSRLLEEPAVCIVDERQRRVG